MSVAAIGSSHAGKGVGTASLLYAMCYKVVVRRAIEQISGAILPLLVLILSSGCAGIWSGRSELRCGRIVKTHPDDPLRLELGAPIRLWLSYSARAGTYPGEISVRPVLTAEVGGRWLTQDDDACLNEPCPFESPQLTLAGGRLRNILFLGLLDDEPLPHNLIIYTDRTDPDADIVFAIRYGGLTLAEGRLPRAPVATGRDLATLPQSCPGSERRP